MFLAVKKIFFDGFSHNQPQEFLSSQWQQNDKSVVYLMYRWVIALFFTFALAYSVYENIELRHFNVCYIYLTHQNFCVTVITTWLGAILVTAHHLGKLDVEKEMTGSLQLYWILWNQTIVFACIITLFYWYSPHDDGLLTYNNLLIHILNSAVLIFDLFIVNHPARFLNFIYFLPTELTYLVFTFVYQHLGGVDKFGKNYVYPRADWKNDAKTAWIHFVVFMAFSIAFHITINSIHSLRRKFHRKLTAKTSFDLAKRTCGVNTV